MATVGKQDGMRTAEMGLDGVGDGGGWPAGVLPIVGVVAGEEDRAIVVHATVATEVEDER